MVPAHHVARADHWERMGQGGCGLEENSKILRLGEEVNGGHSRSWRRAVGSPSLGLGSGGAKEGERERRLRGVGAGTLANTVST